MRKSAVLIVFRRRGVKLPTPPIPLSHFFVAVQIFVVLIVETHGSTDILDNILIGRQIVAAWDFVADGRGRFPIGVDVTTSERRSSVGVLPHSLVETFTAGSRRTGRPIEIEC